MLGYTIKTKRNKGLSGLILSSFIKSLNLPMDHTENCTRSRNLLMYQVRYDRVKFSYSSYLTE